VKIIKILDDTVLVAKQDKSLIEVNIKDFDFPPKIDDEIEVYQNENHTIIKKVEKQLKTIEKPKGTIPVQKLTYSLLAIFLGGLGAHKFYIGKIKTGILMLLFCWTYIPAIIGLIEGLVALSKKSDNGYIYIESK
jgi:TM2 domain-containing membrane protein YozV